MTDLFGAPMMDDDFRRRPKTLITKVLGPLHYRKAETREKSCKTCARCFMHGSARRHWFKCDLVGSSNGPATDVRAGRVCDSWRATP